MKRILFQGDSITDAFRKPEEINQAYQLGNGYVFLAASRLAFTHPGKLEFVNRGVSGDRLEDLPARWQRDALEIKPDMLSLLVGVNDTLREVRGGEGLQDEEFSQIYRDLLRKLRAQNQGICFLLMEPFLLDAGEVNCHRKEHLAPRREIVRGIAGEFGALFVPLQSLFDEASEKAPASHWSYDGIHPTHAGFQLIADAWLHAADNWLSGK